MPECFVSQVIAWCRKVCGVARRQRQELPFHQPVKLTVFPARPTIQAFMAADVAQRQSTAFVKRGLWVQIPPSALMQSAARQRLAALSFFERSVKILGLQPICSQSHPNM